MKELTVKPSNICAIEFSDEKEIPAFRGLNISDKDQKSLVKKNGIVFSKPKISIYLTNGIIFEKFFGDKNLAQMELENVRHAAFNSSMVVIYDYDIK